MTVMSVAGAGMVAVAGIWLGLSLAQRDARRVEHLDEMLAIGQQLRTRMLVEYGLLSESLLRTAKGWTVDNKRAQAGKMTLGAICGIAGERLKQGADPEEAWPGTVPQGLEDLMPSDWRLWLELVVPLGHQAYEGEWTHFEAGLERIQALREAAQAQKVRNEKLWRTLGIAGGLAAGVLLL